ncbi:MAG TPA: HAD-IC family P-type ATPase, partial [Thermodesulfobacteriota bacterium]
LEPLEPHSAGLRAFVAVDGRGAAIITFADRIRPGLADLFRELDRLGIRRKIILSGDHEHNTRAVADALGIDEFRGDLRPEDKVAVVEDLVRQGERVVMLGDGINDAPALSAATVGIALAGHGGGISAEAADLVILGDDPAGVAAAIRISRKAFRIARQSIGVGLGLSGAAMLLAALGHIEPAVGALLQEAIDVAVILNALRAAR